MIDHSSFILENKKPDKNEFIHLYISDPERDKKYNTINKMVEAMKLGLFTGGVYFPQTIGKELNKGTFDRIVFKQENKSFYFTYEKKGKKQTIQCDSNKFKLQHFIAIIKDAGYSVRLEFKEKVFNKKSNLHNYNIFRIKEKLRDDLFNEFNITDKELGSKIFENSWVENDTVRTQVNFMKQLQLLKKIGQSY